MKLSISEDCFNKIKFMCSKINTLEWSGVLLYNVINPDIDNCELEAVDFYPVDKGTAGHTAFEYPVELFDYLINNNLIECKQGLIHSHNNMDVFFSAEDQSELQDNAPKHSLYLSLIVNNRSQMCAKVAQYQKVSYTGITSKRRNFDGTEETIVMQPMEDDYIYTYDCIITKPDDNISFNPDWKVLAQKVIDIVPPKPVTTYNGVARTFDFPDYSKSYGQYAKTNEWNKFRKSDDVVKVEIKFVRQEVLNGKSKTLADACKDYKYESILQGEIIDLYEAYYDLDGPFSDEIEFEVYQQVYDTIKPYQQYKDIKKLMDAINVMQNEFVV